MGLSYQPKAITLSFKEGKPVTYKAQQVTYPTIKSKDLLAYVANAANVPLANIECCVQGPPRSRWRHRQDEGTAQTEGQQPPRLRVFVIPR